MKELGRRSTEAFVGTYLLNTAADIGGIYSCYQAQRCCTEKPRSRFHPNVQEWKSISSQAGEDPKE
jgi:hypothetical protein